jgi:hypothetical protein
MNNGGLTAAGTANAIYEIEPKASPAAAPQQ